MDQNSFIPDTSEACEAAEQKRNNELWLMEYLCNLKSFFPSIDIGRQVYIWIRLFNPDSKSAIFIISHLQQLTHDCNKTLAEAKILLSDMLVIMSLEQITQWLSTHSDNLETELAQLEIELV